MKAFVFAGICLACLSASAEIYYCYGNIWDKKDKLREGGSGKTGEIADNKVFFYDLKGTSYTSQIGVSQTLEGNKITHREITIDLRLKNKTLAKASSTLGNDVTLYYFGKNENLSVTCLKHKVSEK